MLIEVIMSNIFICFLYFIYFYIFLLIYVFFIVIYWGVGGVNKDGEYYIYKVFNYEDYVGEVIFIVFFLLIIL